MINARIERVIAAAEVRISVRLVRQGRGIGLRNAPQRIGLRRRSQINSAKESAAAAGRADPARDVELRRSDGAAIGDCGLRIVGIDDDLGAACNRCR